MRRMTCFILTGLLAVTWTAKAEDTEVKIAVNEVPKPLIESVKKRFGNARMTGAAREMEEGKVFYEVTVLDNGRKTDVILTPKGSITMIERMMKPKDLPASVTKAVSTKFGKVRYAKAEQIIEVKGHTETLTFYEVLVGTEGKGAYEIKLTTTGSIVEEEQKPSIRGDANDRDDEASEDDDDEDDDDEDEDDDDDDDDD